jgi:hypothetical protein
MFTTYLLYEVAYYYLFAIYKVSALHIHLLCIILFIIKSVPYIFFYQFSVLHIFTLHYMHVYYVQEAQQHTSNTLATH